jgi:ankyrin repeat protein
VYTSLEKNGLEFTIAQNYHSTLLISVLLEIGSDPSINDNEALYIVCRIDNTEGARLLLADTRVSTVSVGYQCLSYAISNENREMVQLLISADADSVGDDNELLFGAVEIGDHVIVESLLSDRRAVVNLVSAYRSENDESALGIAAGRGYIEIVKLLLRAGADHHVNYFRPLWNAAENERLDVVRILLDKNWTGDVLNLNRQQVLENMIGRASKFGSRELMTILLATDTNPSTNNNYALRMARRYKRSEIEELLLLDPRVRSSEH